MRRETNMYKDREMAMMAVRWRELNFTHQIPSAWWAEANSAVCIVIRTTLPLKVKRCLPHLVSTLGRWRSEHLRMWWWWMLLFAVRLKWKSNKPLMDLYITTHLWHWRVMVSLHVMVSIVGFRGLNLHAEWYGKSPRITFAALFCRIWRESKSRIVENGG